VEKCDIVTGPVTGHHNTTHFSPSIIMQFFRKSKKKRGAASHEVESTHSSTSSAHPDGKQSKALSGKIVGNNGWLAMKEALKVVKDSVPGSIVPVKAALVGVLAVMDHVEVSLHLLFVKQLLNDIDIES